MRTIIVLSAALTLAACETSPTVAAAAERGVDAYRAANADMANIAEAFMCRGISIREWMIRYGTPERAAAWRELCRERTTDELPTE